ncbi:Acyl carrier protein [Phycisphaerae bacterium RAS1]|nr:Acyl carrier protein [Phycisphaerae bacterium RAS1]
MTTTTIESIEKTMCELASDVVGADPAGVTLDTHLVDDLNYDSLDQVEFSMKIEDAFEVSVPDEAAERVRTVRHAVELLLKLRTSAGAGDSPPSQPRL